MGADVDATNMSATDFANLFKINGGGKSDKNGISVNDIEVERKDGYLIPVYDEELEDKKNKNGKKRRKKDKNGSRVTDQKLVARLREIQAIKAAPEKEEEDQPENLLSADEDKKLPVAEVGSALKEKVFEEEKKEELEIKNGLPTTLLSSVETTNESSEVIWGGNVWKDLKLAVGYSPERDEAQKRLKAKYNIAFDKAVDEPKEVQQMLLSAIDVTATGKSNKTFADAEMARNELRKYFGAKLEENDTQEPKIEKEKLLEERDPLDEYLYAGGLLVFSDNKKEMVKNIKEARARAMLKDIYDAVTRNDEKARERLLLVGIKLLPEGISEEVQNALKTRFETEGKLWEGFISSEKAEEFLLNAFKIENALKLLLDHYDKVREKKEADLRNRVELALDGDNLRLLRNWTIARKGVSGFDLSKTEEVLKEIGFDLSALGDIYVEEIREALNRIVLDKSEMFKTKKEAQNRLMVFYRKKDADNKEAVKIEKVEPVEDKEREKYLEYLGEGLLEDLKNIYPPFGTSIDGKVYSRSFHRLEGGNRLKRIWTKSIKRGFEGKDVRDFRSGQESIRLIENFLSMDAGYPKDWSDELMREMVVGRSLEQFKVDLEEARKRKQEKNNKEVGIKSESKMDKKEELASLVREDLAGEDLNKFYRAINVIVSNNAIGSEFNTVDEAREFFSLNIKVDLKTEGRSEPKEGEKDEENNAFVLTLEIRQKLKDWADIARKLRRPNLPNEDENLRELIDLGFEVDRADLGMVLEALESISFTKDDKDLAEKYLMSLFVGGSGGNAEPEKPTEPKNNTRENGEINEEERWNKVSDLLIKMETVEGEERKALYLEIEQCGVRISGTISDLIEAGANEEEVKKSFRHMSNMVKVWKMGEVKAKREYPKMVEKYASLARLLRLKWYN